ncbi:hypothetical protein ELD05_03455 [Caldicellulosiruptor changbaiensis]|uniref:Uncharacterized protein n=1 Tax=Caldicellulosiruptor changbaiensis TaxID=1222016 RepID=A0A3T0D3R7_9FIRM|nr:hypothetical protein [Caldicellulosiruptor changbaiensis]AZT89784.1 hypothetical protein ELD05_03455 [Caldicellulosiruptor changbaiensis]
MDAYVVLFIFFGLIVVFISLKSIKKDIEKGEKVLIESAKTAQKLSQLLNEAIETIEELDNFGEYIIERIENKVKWAEEETSQIRDRKNENFKESQKGYESLSGNEEIDIKDTRNANDMKNLENLELISEKQSKEEIYRRAVELYRQGFSIEEIASTLQIGKGETKLALKIVGREKV